jgi:class 3 adenylate cyclase/tetratricopeptide (TPR) repeat protein/DNA-binding CsgD family transcriptional regulator
MTELPSGTVTFLFTDIEGSTMRLKEVGAERYSEVLERHNELLRSVFAAHGGVEVESLGDGLFVVFQSAEDALEAVTESQRALAAEPWPTRRPIGVRMGLHTGEALVRGGTYVGYAVHHAARIGDMGHGGQALLSEATAALVRHDLTASVRLRSLGEVAIADADRPQHLYQLEIEGLRMDFPPLRVKQRRVLTPTPERIVERSDELATLGELVDAAHGGFGRFGVIVGNAGIGKTTLVSEVRLAAELRGMAVLQARGSELEHDFSYGIVRQLFEPRIAGASFDERREILAGSAAIADQLFEERGTAPLDFGPVDTSFALLHGLYWLTANLASERPVLILIDDLHWADDPSLRWLGYLVRRLEGLPVLVVVALRPPEQGFEKVLLTELVQDPAARLILPKTLSSTAVEALVRSVLSADADAEFSRACFEATGGNPLLLRALLDALASERVPPRAEYAGAVMEIGPRAVARAVELRLARLPSESVTLARAAAVLGEDAELGVVAALAELDRDVAAHAATALVKATILRFDATLGFVHPVVRAALYSQLTQPELEREHLKAARVLSDHRASAERIAAQLLLAPPSGDDFAIDALAEAADASLRRGDPRGAARYLRRALDESPDDRAVQAELYTRLGRAERLLSSPGAAEPLRKALELAETPEQRALIARELGTALFYGLQVEEAIGVFQQSIAELDEEHVDVRRLLEGALLSVTCVFPALYPIAQMQKERIAQLGLADDVGSRMINAILSYDDARRLAPVEEAIGRAEQALALGPLHSEDNAAYIFAVYTLALADRFADAEAVWDQAWVDAQARGSISAYAVVSTFRAFVELHTGRLDEALTDASNGLQACQEYGFETGIPYAVAHIADAALELGDIEVARTAVEQLDAVGDGTHLVWAFLDSRGRTRIAQGNTRAGLEDVLEAGREYEGLDGRNPALLAWRSTAALAHLELGEREEAVRLAREEVELARQWGRPRAIGQALRIAGMVEPDSAAGLALLREAVAVLEGSPARPARARALVELGIALGAAGEQAEAKDALLDGLELARAMRASALAIRAEEALVALGVEVPERPTAGFDALSASERRVVAYAAEGFMVDEIAQSLFLTPATVEDYLARARRTLGVQTNDELARALTSLGSDASEVHVPV